MDFPKSKKSLLLSDFETVFTIHFHIYACLCVAHCIKFYFYLCISSSFSLPLIFFSSFHFIWLFFFIYLDSHLLLVNMFADCLEVFIHYICYIFLNSINFSMLTYTTVITLHKLNNFVKSYWQF